MKLYYICECCEEVFDVVEAEGEGLGQVQAMCPDCTRELGRDEPSSLLNNTFYYH
ncbi:MAG: hypothetical protein GX964_09700 [Syntrophomonadaceae bacterium]|nr:hypothetical protein [Syntrophomonadaceae bacterium]